MIEFFKRKIEETLETLIPPDSPYFPSLYEGGRYTLFGSAKRIRPLLTICTAEMLKEHTLDVALYPACAIELIHTYSLIHDDLPCMDNDDFRRGKPTLHRIYSEGHAVLIGDYLLTYAFEIIATAPYLTADQKITLIQKLASAAGAEGMVGGQMMDIESSRDIEQMHARKTAALFSAAVEFGGIIASCSQEALVQVQEFGLQFGKLFQAVDDLQDEEYPLGKQIAERSFASHLQKSIDLLERLPFNTLSLKKLIDQVSNGNTDCISRENTQDSMGNPASYF